MPVIVFSKPSCVQCNGTYRSLDKNDAEYQSIDLTQNLAAYNFVVGLGSSAAPVVVVIEEVVDIVENELVGTDFESLTVKDHWSGYNPNKINEHTKVVEPE